MELNILRIDLDEPNRKEAIEQLAERIKYFKDFGFADLKYWHKIELVKKRTYGARITLIEPVRDSRSIITLQLVFGSDWRKEINTFFNDVVLEMDYSNRLFNGKAYKKGFMVVDPEDVTEEVLAVAASNKVYNWRKFLVSKIKRFFK